MLPLDTWDILANTCSCARAWRLAHDVRLRFPVYSATCRRCTSLLYAWLSFPHAQVQAYSIPRKTYEYAKDTRESVQSGKQVQPFGYNGLLCVFVITLYLFSQVSASLPPPGILGKPNKKTAYNQSIKGWQSGLSVKQRYEALSLLYTFIHSLSTSNRITQLAKYQEHGIVPFEIALAVLNG